VKENPLVEMEGIRCYAGVPMVSSRGHVLGNFCVKGKEERSFNEKQIKRLKEMAGEIVDYIESKAQSLRIKVQSSCIRKLLKGPIPESL